MATIHPNYLSTRQIISDCAHLSPNPRHSNSVMCLVLIVMIRDSLQLTCLCNTPPASCLTTLNINRNHNRRPHSTCGGGGVKVKTLEEV